MGLRVCLNAAGVFSGWNMFVFVDDLGRAFLLTTEDHLDGFAIVTSFIVRHTRDKARP